MSSVTVDLFADDDERRRSRRERQRIIGSLLFAGAIVALLIPTTKTASIGALSFEPASVIFGAQPLGSQTSRSVTISNGGEARFAASRLTIEGGPNDFSLAAENCGSIAPVDSCTAEVLFAPRAAGEQKGALTLTSDSGEKRQISLTGAGVAKLLLKMTPEAASFPDQRVGTESTPLEITIANRGNGDDRIVSITTDNEQFRFGGGCIGATLHPGDDCKASVGFAPATPGAASGNVIVADLTGVTYTAPLSGNGIIHHFFAETDAVTFTEINSDNKESKPIRFANDGGDAVLLSEAVVSGPGFLKEDDGCSGKALPPKTSCVVTVSSFGTRVARSGTLVVRGPEDETTVRLEGREVAPPPRPLLEIEPKPITFGVMAKGLVREPVHLHNNGNAPLFIKNISFEPPSKMFEVITACKVIQPHSECDVILVRRTVDAVRPRLRVDSDSPTSPDFVDIVPRKVLNMKGVDQMLRPVVVP
jgi:hypothetical protein